MGPPDNERGRPAKAAPTVSTAISTETSIDDDRADLDADRAVGGSALRRALLDGSSLKAMTVLAPQNDPYRLDTPASHRDGEWLAVQLRDLGVGDQQVHLRGLHYMFIGMTKPDGSAYANDDPDWHWLAGVMKSARWLNYIGFDQIVDRRNAAPVVRISTESTPLPYLDVGVQVEIPPVDEIMPTPLLFGFTGRQPYKIVMFGEKSSLETVLAPIADRYGCDLYLPTGEISDTMLHQMAKTGADDGRPMVVLCFSDCDPAGWQMPISIGRKLQAFRTAMFPGLDFEVHRVALTPDQVREYGLPSTPLKESEKRAAAWRELMGTAQTEVDALAALRPDLLQEIARDAVSPYFDSTLDSRVWMARNAWRIEAQAIVDDGISDEILTDLRAEAEDKLVDLQQQIDQLNESLRVDASAFDLPTPVVPEAVVSDEQHGKPLLDSRWSFAEQTRRLIASKAYATEGGEVR
ncbi:MAG: hypothetical protein M3423_08940 [Actinomycetota bacterium]|nr:hypothetical protein [Actinomycetota bacterium]